MHSIHSLPPVHYQRRMKQKVLKTNRPSHCSLLQNQYLACFPGIHHPLPYRSHPVKSFQVSISRKSWNTTREASTSFIKI